MHHSWSCFHRSRLCHLADHIADRATSLTYGAQDISTDDAGAYTGETSGSMLTDVGCRYVLAGHSERRDRHYESDKTVNAKIRAALRHGLTPILCIGEGLDVRQQGTHVDHTLAQLDQALADVDAFSAATMLIAYEPIWAIGTGEVATPEDAQEVCAAIRGRTAELFDYTVADQIRILYGGSVKSTTSREILSQPDIDGALVGGASLDADELIAIWQTAKPRQS